MFPHVNRSISSLATRRNEDMVISSYSEDDSNVDPDNEEMVNNRYSEDDLNIDPDNEELVEISDTEVGDSCASCIGQM